MTHTRSGYRIVHRQAGAALVVGLLMLLVLTVLGISGVNTSSLNLIMAGNTQYSENAFQAAEACIEQALAGNEFNPARGRPTERQENVPVGNGATCTRESIVQLCGDPQPALPGASLRSFSTFHFQIDSDGKANQRDAVARHVQAIAVIAPAGSDVSALRDASNPATCSGGGGVGTLIQ